MVAGPPSARWGAEAPRFGLVVIWPDYANYPGLNVFCSDESDVANPCRSGTLGVHHCRLDLLSLPILLGTRGRSARVQPDLAFGHCRTCSSRSITVDCRPHRAHDPQNARVTGVISPLHKQSCLLYTS